MSPRGWLASAAIAALSIASVATAAGAAQASTSATTHRAAHLHGTPLLRPGGRLHLTSHQPHGLRNAQSTSTNWAGWAAYNSTYTSVTTTFTQPSVDCGQGDGYSAFWVGLDGYNSDSVEQTGTEADCSGGQASYSAWYEMYPADSVNYSDTVASGDVITETVTYSNGEYDLVLNDSTQGWTENTQQAGTYSNASAEVIAEAPSSGTGRLPLSDFGTVDFGNSTIDGSPISSFTADQIDMQSSDGTTEATTSALDSSGEDFSVTWDSL